VAGTTVIVSENRLLRVLVSVATMVVVISELTLGCIGETLTGIPGAVSVKPAGLFRVLVSVRTTVVVVLRLSVVAVTTVGEGW
jgi:hypothetical protein